MINNIRPFFKGLEDVFFRSCDNGIFEQSKNIINFLSPFLKKIQFEKFTENSLDFLRNYLKEKQEIIKNEKINKNISNKEIIKALKEKQKEIEQQNEKRRKILLNDYEKNKLVFEIQIADDIQRIEKKILNKNNDSYLRENLEKIKKSKIDYKNRHLKNMEKVFKNEEKKHNKVSSIWKKTFKKNNILFEKKFDENSKMEVYKNFEKTFEQENNIFFKVLNAIKIFFFVYYDAYYDLWKLFSFK